MNEFYRIQGLNVETYDAIHDAPGAVSDGDIKFYKSWAYRMKGPVLEIGCGTGRIMLEIAHEGIEIVGLDLSAAMLDIAKLKCQAFPESTQKHVSFIQADMTEFDLGRKFSLIIIPFRAWQILTTPESQRQSLLTFRRHLTDDGRLIINNFDPRLDYCLPGMRDMSFLNKKVKHPVTGNDVTIKITQHFNDTLNQILNEKWEFEEIDSNGNIIRHEEESLSIRWTYRWEMRYLFELTGFELETEFSDYNGSPPDYGREQVWIVRKSPAIP
jgi:ubiquinone/menaquinone biosynthesis C-methylase UbiE